MVIGVGGWRTDSVHNHSSIISALRWEMKKGDEGYPPQVALV